MPTYRVYFRGGSGIAGRQDFAALDEQDAITMAESLCDACSDSCNSFELWQGRRFIAGPRTPRARSEIDGLIGLRQAAAVEHEEMMLSSRLAIASSQRLLERLNELRGPSK